MTTRSGGLLHHPAALNPAKPPWQLGRSSPSSCSPVLDESLSMLPPVDDGNAWWLGWSAYTRSPKCLVPALILVGCHRGGFVLGRLDWYFPNLIRLLCCEQMSWQRYWVGR